MHTRQHVPEPRATVTSVTVSSVRFALFTFFNGCNNDSQSLNRPQPEGTEPVSHIGAELQDLLCMRPECDVVEVRK